MTFELRVVHLDDGRIERGRFDTAPDLQQAAEVVRLLREFLAGKPAQFRESMPFLKRGSLELEWAAASGGVAFATFYESGSAVTMAVFATQPRGDAGQGVLEGLRGSLGLGTAETEPGDGPLAVVAMLPGAPEWQPTLHLLNASLGAVYFAAMTRAETP